MTDAHRQGAHFSAEQIELRRTALRRMKRSALAVCGLMAAGIAGLMILAAGKGEDITGIVAPALVIMLVSGLVATVAAVLQKRAEKRP